MSKSQVIEDEIVEMLSTIVEEKDAYTAGHSKRVALYSMKIAHALGLDEEVQKDIYQAGLLHDIGKIGIPDKIQIYLNPPAVNTLVNIPQFALRLMERVT